MKLIVNKTYLLDKVTMKTKPSMNETWSFKPFYHLKLLVNKSYLLDTATMKVELYLNGIWSFKPFYQLKLRVNKSYLLNRVAMKAGLLMNETWSFKLLWWAYVNHQIHLLIKPLYKINMKPKIYIGLKIESKIQL